MMIKYIQLCVCDRSECGLVDMHFYNTIAQLSRAIPNTKIFESENQYNIKKYKFRPRVTFFSLQYFVVAPVCLFNVLTFYLLSQIQNHTIYNEKSIDKTPKNKRSILQNTENKNRTKGCSARQKRLSFDPLFLSQIHGEHIQKFSREDNRHLLLGTNRFVWKLCDLI